MFILDAIKIILNNFKKVIYGQGGKTKLQYGQN